MTAKRIKRITVAALIAVGALICCFSMKNLPKRPENTEAGIKHPENHETSISEEKVEYAENDDTLILDGVISFCQYPDYPTGCECVSLYILLNYFDVDADVDEIIDAVPKGPVPYGDGPVSYGANPEREFVGDPYSYKSYGVFEKPLAVAAESFKSGAVTMTGAGLEDVREIIRSGSPVIAWCSIDEDKNDSAVTEWLDFETGETVSWLSGEHAVVIYGFSDEKLYISDPSTGTKREADAEKFMRGVEKYGGRILHY